MPNQLRMVLLATLATAITLAVPGSVAAKTTVHLLTLDGVINPVAADLIQRLIRDAEEAGAECVILELDTPGGLMKSMRVICKDILASPIPFVTYVGPAGARAASAGTWITLASHVAVMNTSSSIGAAHPAQLGQSAPPDSTMENKVVNDAVSFIRSLAERHGRNADWAEQAVRESASITATEALEKRVVDLVVDDLDALLEKLDGRMVELEGGPVRLETRGAEVVRFEIGLRDRILNAVSDPNIAYILFTLGLLGLAIELYNPGAILPGVVGGISVILAFYALHTLPVNYAGLLLIVFAVILFVLETTVTSFGILTIGGVISMLLGSLMLIDRSIEADFLRIRLEVILPTVAVTALAIVFALAKGMIAQRRQPSTGREGLVGEAGEAVTDLGPGRDGQVRVHGELWAASSHETIHGGDPIRVLEARGLRLVVERA